MKRIIDEVEIEKIKNFERNCDEMINGKFILADVKISNILKSIAQSTELFNLMSVSLQGFNFSAEFESAKVINPTERHFLMPTEQSKIIAMVFCFLLDVDNKKIAFYDFINSFFKTPDQPGSEYARFAHEMLVPFKEAIMNYFDFTGEEKVEQNANVNVEINSKQLPTENVENTINEQIFIEENVQDKLIRLLQNMKNVIEFTSRIKDKKKEELLIYIRALIEALKIGNKKITTALLVGFDTAIKRERVLKEIYEEFTLLLIKLY